MPEPVIPPGVRTLGVLPRTPAPPPTEATFARKPAWLKVKASQGPNYRELKGLVPTQPDVGLKHSTDRGHALGVVEDKISPLSEVVPH